MSKTAIILAGGKGTRLRPYTWVLPKPLMPLGEEPILEIVIQQLVKSGFKNIILAVNHHAEIIKAVIGDGKRFGAKITYSLEKKALSTMGPLKLMKNLPENFLVMNGDILTDLPFKTLFEVHLEQKSLFTISGYHREHKVDYGVLHQDKKGFLTGFEEKPTQAYSVSMGIYVLNKKVLQFIPKDKAFGFDHLMYKLLEEKQKVQVRNHKGLWLDIGRPDDYMQAIEAFEKLKPEILK